MLLIRDHLRTKGYLSMSIVTNQTSSVLSINNLSVSYGNTHVLKGVCVDLTPGNITGVVGKNGAGKSTLLKAISGEVRISGGSIFLEKKDISETRTDARSRQGIRCIPQGVDSLFSSLTVKEHLLLASRLLEKKEQKSELEKVLERFDFLKSRFNAKAGTFSGGERQILALGMALVAKPKVLLVDEPSHGLSLKMRKEAVEWLTALKSDDMSVLLAEQFPRMAAAVCDRIFTLENGNF